MSLPMIKDGEAEAQSRLVAAVERMQEAVSGWQRHMMSACTQCPESWEEAQSALTALRAAVDERGKV